MMGEFINKVKNIKGIGLIAIGVIAGIVLIIIGSMNSKQPDLKPAEEPLINLSETYTEKLEIKLRELIESIDGVSNAKVMLTLDSGSEYIYAQNNSENKREYVIISEADKSETLTLVKEINPKIRGVVVVCQGGNNPVVQSQIINLLSTLFNLPSNRVYVTG